MADSRNDNFDFDDISFYIGEDGFCASNSVCDSVISNDTYFEFDDDWSRSDEYEDDCALNISSRHECESGVRSFRFITKSCAKSFDGSVEPDLTVSCTSQSLTEPRDDLHISRGCIECSVERNDQHLLRNRLEEDVSSLPSLPCAKMDSYNEIFHEREQPELCAGVSRQTSQEILNEILSKPLYFSALLVFMAHQPNMRNARLCGTHQCIFSQDVPIIIS